MRIVLKIVLAFAVLTSTAFLLAVGEANAATFTLTNANKDSGLSILITVRAGALSGSSCDLTASGPSFGCFEISYTSSNLVNTPLGIDVFDYNTPLLNFPGVNTANTFTTSGWSSTTCPDGTPPSGCQADGFGRFLSEATSPGGTDLIVGLALNGSTTISTNSDGARFAVHIRFGPNPTTQQGCSLWVSDGTASSVDSLETAGCATIVAEPGSLALLGTGLAGVMLVLRRRKPEAYVA